MIINKKILTIISLLLSILLLFTAVSNEYFALKTSAHTTVDNNVVILDAGHGGFDGGAVAYDGTVEKDINLKITLTLRDLLKNSGFNVILTRESDTSTDDVETQKITTKKKSDLNNRLNLMKDYKNGIFVSIHLNKFTTTSANGSQIFYRPDCDKSKLLSDLIQKSIVTNLQPDNERVNKKATKSTYLLYNATIPAVLVECGFISNRNELEKLKDEKYQKQMAFSIFCGILNYYSN